MLMLFFMAVATKAFSQTNQKEGNIWYFGHFAGLDFNTSPPQALTNGKLDTHEGGASMCNKHGNLLFYTDGVKVYNKNHAIMSNGTGLTGHNTSTQSAIIVQNPDSANIHYVFTTNAQPGINFTTYSKVDTTLDSGLGEITLKNVTLNGQAGEKLSAARHANGKDLWVVTHQSSNDKFYAYLVTGSGVSTTPVISSIGQSHQSLSQGCMKFSPTGRKLLVTESQVYFVELFDFNTVTGVVSNPIAINSGSPFYGAEFSPSGRYIYTVPFNGSNQLCQYDLISGTQSGIQNSKQVISTITGSGSLQLGPDNKIYMSFFGLDTMLGVINKPDLPGSACDFVSRGILLAGKKSGVGLPTLNPSLFGYPKTYIGTGAIACGQLTFDIYNTGDSDKIVTSFWDFGDGTSDTGRIVSKTYSAHGRYTIRNIVKLVLGGVYTDTLYKTITTKPFPKAEIEKVEQQFCYDKNLFVFADSTKYFNGNIYKSNSWKFSDATFAPKNISTVIKNSNQVGTFKITLIVTSSNNCTDTALDSVTVFPSAQTSFTADKQQCFNTHKLLPIHQTAVDTPGAITGYAWDFGDNTTSNQAAPAKIYTTTGKYPVQLVALEKNGCNDTFVTNYTVLPSPKVGFSALDVCNKDSVIIKNTTSIENGGLTYKWTYGDGNTSNVFEANRLYADTGNYMIKLIAVSDSLCNDSATKTVRIKPKPNAAFTYNGWCAQNPVYFTDNSVLYNVPVINNKWFFGDGNTATTNGNAQHIYPTHGLYSVKLLTHATNGCKDSTTRQIYVSPPPIAGFNIDAYAQCLKGNNFVFTNISTVPQGNIKQYQWFTNDILYSSTSNYTHNFSNSGAHSIKLKAETDSGCFDSITKTVIVHPQVNIAVNINDTAQCFTGHEFDIKNNSTISTGSIINNNWLFSDNTAQNSFLPTPKKFSTYGNNWVQYIMETDQGCLDTFKQNLFVYFSPTPAFEVDSICLGEVAYFDNTTADPDGTIVRWDWNFGSIGAFSTQKSPNYKYTAAGNYLVQLTATTEKGCKATLDRFFTNLVKPIPTTNFEDTLLDSYERYSTFKFTNGSTGASNYLWDFGDGTTSTDADPEKIYEILGQINPTLTAYNEWGCTSVFGKTLYLTPKIYIQIPNAFTPGRGDDLNPIFRAEGVYFTKEFSMEIFTRWGERVFKTNDAAHGWDGKYDGHAMQEGTYTYVIRLMDYNNKVRSYFGVVTLLR